jgi:hypothetical protein
MSLAKAERALENRAHVRMLLRLRQPAFAAALASAEQDFFTARRGVARQTCSAAGAWPGPMDSAWDFAGSRSRRWAGRW